jgi:hypothetical protein
MQYARTGTNDSLAPATKSGQKQGMEHFKKFLLTKQLKFEEIEPDDVCKEFIFQEFGTYLSSFARFGKEDELLSCGTALQYLSGVKMYLSKYINDIRYTKHPIWEKDDSWYSDIYAGAVQCHNFQEIIRKLNVIA